MTDENIVRELAKILDSVTWMDGYLSCKDRMNANLHLSQEVRPTPLAASVKTAKYSLQQLIAELSGS